MTYHVFGIGNALLDIQFDIDYDFLDTHQLPKGLMSYVEHERQTEIINTLGQENIRQISSGGSVANSMVALSYFGAKGFFACRVADDDAGAQYHQEMSAAGLDSTFDTCKKTDGKTGRCVVKVTPDADRTMSTYLGSSIELCEDQINYEALKNSEYFYIEGYLMTSPKALTAVKKAVVFAREHGVKIAITLSDPDIVQAFKPAFHDIIDDGVDLIFCNEQEALEFTDTTHLDDAEKALKKVTKTFAITIGPRGSIVFDGNRLITVPATEEIPIDTLGAGDMYAGAFLYAITHGYDWEMAGRLANITSSKVVTIFGPRVSKEHIQELLAQLHQKAEEAA